MKKKVTKKKKEKPRGCRESSVGAAEIIRESNRDMKNTKGERHEKVCAVGSDPAWADEMGDGWGGVRDKSQRGLGPWESLLLWSVRRAASQWSTWTLSVSTAAPFTWCLTCSWLESPPELGVQFHSYVMICALFPLNGIRLFIWFALFDNTFLKTPQQNKGRETDSKNSTFMIDW